MGPPSHTETSSPECGRLRAFCGHAVDQTRPENQCATGLHAAARQPRDYTRGLPSHGQLCPQGMSSVGAQRPLLPHFLRAPSGTASEQLQVVGPGLAGHVRSSSSRRAVWPFCQAGSDRCPPTCHSELDVSIRAVWVAFLGLSTGWLPKPGHVAPHLGKKRPGAKLSRPREQHATSSFARSQETGRRF